MKSNKIRLFLAVLAALISLYLGAGSVLGQEQAKKQNPPTTTDEEPYTEEEYDAYEKATQEPDVDKRAVALTAFIDKYPKSALMPYITSNYAQLLYDLQQKQDYKRLGPFAEKWLKYAPDDLPTIAYIAEASQKTGDHKKFIEYGEKVYAAKPSGNLCYFIAQSHKELGNQAKYLEWTEKSFQYFPEDFGIRMEFVSKYAKEEKFDKAAEYAQLALKSLEVAKKPEKTSESDWQKAVRDTRRSCNYLIGVNHYDKDKYAEAIKAMESTLKVDPKFDFPYYYIGLSLMKIAYAESNLDKMEDAILWFAKAELLKGEAAPKAKENLERLYKATHNNTLIGVERRYRKAAQELGLPPGS